MKEVLKLALEALEDRASLMKWQIARDAVKEVLAQQDVRDEIDRGAKTLRETYLAQPESPPECQTEAEKTAFAFGWFKAMEAQRKPEQEPDGYVQTVIEALYENGDPISVDAAELLQRISAQPAQERPQNCGTGYCSCIECVMEPEQEPVAWLWELTGEVTTDSDRADGMWLPLYTAPPQKELVCVCGAVWEGQELIYTTPQRTDEEEYLSKAYRLANELRCHLAIAPAPQRKPLTDEQIKQDFEKWAKETYVQGFEPYGNSYHNGHTRNRWQGWLAAHRAIEAAHGIKE